MDVNQANEKVKEILGSIDCVDGLEKARVDLFGKNGIINTVRRGIVNVPKEQKREFGQKVNGIKTEAEAEFEKIKEHLEKEALRKKIENEKIDVTAPGTYVRQGSRHPINIVMEDLCSIFKAFGFSVETGPEIESEDNNFDKLNIPPLHPARAMQDSFYMPAGHVLRTHTSPVQIRTMMKSQPPIKIVAPGRVYRKDDIDATHSPVFHQIEGLYIDNEVTLADLKAVLMAFAKNYYGENTKIRFQPSYFPFTEPSAEVYVSCMRCEGRGDSDCPVCKGTAFLEIMGCGMVHPEVLRKSGIDPEEYKGFAFGMGIERIAMLKYGINDIRYLFENDQRFLRKF